MTSDTIVHSTSLGNRLDHAEKPLLAEYSADTLSPTDTTRMFQAGVRSLQVCQSEISAAQERLSSLIDLARRRSQNAAVSGTGCEPETHQRGSAPVTVSLPLEVAPCPICGGTDMENLGRGDRYAMDLRTARCRLCGFIHTNPRPTAHSLNAFYKGPYRGLYEHPEKPTLAGTLGQGMQNRAYHTVNTLASARLLPAASLLDAGCGEGSVLRELRQRYGSCRLQGVEPDHNYAAFAADYAGCAVAQSLDDVQGDFTVVTTIHVLEHVLEPVNFLRNLSRWLSPDGKLYVEVPDAGRYVDMHALHLAHLNHFTAESLLAAGRAAGLHALEIVKHNPPFNPPSLYAVFVRNSPAVTALRSILHSSK